MVNGEKIILGAAGWGSPYGLRSVVPSDDELCDILTRAQQLGIREIDTAPGYGASEARVARLVRTPDFVEYSVRTKVSRGSADVQAASVERSLELFGDALTLLQFHNYEPSDEPALRRLQRNHGLRVGATTYGAPHAAAAFKSFGRVQAEWNVLNKRALTELPAGLIDSEVSVRSVLLQGLLAGAEVPRYLLELLAPISRLTDFARGLPLSLPAFAIAAALTDPKIDRVVVGVDHVNHLAPIADALAADFDAVCEIVQEFSFEPSDPAVLDPRRWSTLRG